MIAPVTLPEIILLQTIQAGLKFVRDDYATATVKQKSWLYMALNGAALEKYGLYDQAVAVICGAEDSPRLFGIDLMFNMKRDHMPTAHITLPAEATPGTGNGIGTDEGYAEIEYEDDEENPIGQDPSLNEDTSRSVYSRRMTATYNIVIVSDNSNEIILLYHFLRALLIALIPHLHLNRLQNVSFGGQDVQPYEELANKLYMRALSVRLEYDTFVPSIHPNKLINSLEVTGTPVAQ